MEEKGSEQSAVHTFPRGLAAIFLATMATGYAVYAVDRTVLSGVLSTMSTSLSLNNFQVGLLASAQYVGVLAVVLIAGQLADRYGARRILLAGLVVFSLFTWLIGLATGFWEAFALRLISGIGEGLFWPVAMASVATVFGQRKGFALGAFYVGFDVGSVAGPAVAGLGLSLSGDWGLAFFVAPLAGIVPIGMALAGGRRFDVQTSHETRLRIGRDALEQVRRREVAIMMVFAFLATWASVLQVVFLPYYFNKALNYGAVYSDYLTAGILVSGGAGKLVLGPLSDKVNRRWMLATISGVVAVAYAAFFASSSLAPVILAAIAMSFFSAGTFPVMQALMADNCEGQTGTALGLNTTAQSVATVLSPIISASLFGIGVGRALAADALIPAAACILVALLLKEPRRPTR